METMRRKGTMSDFAMTRTCPECPWLLSSKPGKFPPERYKAMADTCRPGGIRPVFACHMTPDGNPRACAGMILVCGRDSNLVRVAAMSERFEPSQITASGPLYPSYLAMAAANGCDISDPIFEGMI
jgi:Family of unknown function (DUF6283)